ncbi:hypothetical protein D9758_011061 [Tetrapyrgos nigripes]|uniref:Uncharacterized protein n=1 Tax=Tetrapyrgos nigripes TaxID=182062 RepID=A0A8H5FRR1_9AGAR|nr:hypothetical protein D9758_011061 [Tetrapyrgos nigripes]
MSRPPPPSFSSSSSSTSFPVASTSEGGVGHNISAIPDNTLQLPDAVGGPSSSPSPSILSISSRPRPIARVVPHSQDTIRMTTMELSGISFPSTPGSTPRTLNAFGDLEVQSVSGQSGNTSGYGGGGGSGNGEHSTYQSGMSGLSLLRPRSWVGGRRGEEDVVQDVEQGQDEEDEEDVGVINSSPTPTPTRIPSPSHSPSAKWVHHRHHIHEQDTHTQPQPQPGQGQGHRHATSTTSPRPAPERRTTIRWAPSSLASASPEVDAPGSDHPRVDASPDVNERTPLLTTQSPSSTKPLATRLHARFSSTLSSLPSHATILSSLSSSSQIILPAVLHAIPAIILGSLLNILDGLSYGMIMFPSSWPFSSATSPTPSSAFMFTDDDSSPSVVPGGAARMGVSMFFVSCIVAQVVYSCGGRWAGSGFSGANGSMMIEVVPFFHILASSITAQILESASSLSSLDTDAEAKYLIGKQIVSTTIVAYALSSVLTGM